MGFWVSVLSVVVKLRPLPAALKIISPNARPSRRGTGEAAEGQLANAIDVLLGVRFFIFKPICWKRAAILHRYLALSGVSTRIVFGVRNANDSGLTGHAWLELDGKPILETSAPEYTVTYTFPSRDVCITPLALFTKSRQKAECSKQKDN